MFRALVRLGAGRHGGRGGDAVRVLHAVHRRIGRDDSRARRAAAAGAPRRGLSRAVFDRPADRVRIARPALSALAAADALRHRLAEGVDRGPLHRRPAAGPADARAARALGVREGARGEAPSGRRSASREALAAIWEAKWELLLPVFVVGTFVGGVATLVESAPMAALYTLIVQRFIHRDLPIVERRLPRRGRLRRARRRRAADPRRRAPG